MSSVVRGYFRESKYRRSCSWKKIKRKSCIGLIIQSLIIQNINIYIEDAKYNPFVSGNSSETEVKEFVCNKIERSGNLLNADDLKAQQELFSRSYGIIDSDDEASDLSDAWNAIALRRTNKEFAEKGHCVFYVLDIHFFKDDTLEELEIGPGYIKYKGHYAGEKSRYKFDSGDLVVYPSAEDDKRSKVKGEFSIDLTEMYNNHMFLLVASKLLGVDLDVVGYK